MDRGPTNGHPNGWTRRENCRTVRGPKRTGPESVRLRKHSRGESKEDNGEGDLKPLV